METFVKEVTLGVPVKRDAGGPLTLKLEAKGQGCNEPIGVCYPPQTRIASVQLAAADTASTTDVPAQPAVQSPDDIAKATDSDASDSGKSAPDKGTGGVSSLKSLSELFGSVRRR